MASRPIQTFSGSCHCGAEALAPYRFHTHRAQHHFCRVCGIYPFHRKRVTPDFYGIPVRETHGASLE